MIGPMALGGNLDPEQAALAAGALLLVSVLLVLLGVPESKPPTPAAAAGGGAGLVLSPAGAAAAHRRRSPLDVLSSLGRSWQLINSSSLFRRLAVCMAVVGIVSEVRGTRVGVQCLCCTHCGWPHTHWSLHTRMLLLLLLPLLLLLLLPCNQQGIQDMLLQYLQLTLNFSTADTTVLITVLGAGNFFVQVGGCAGLSWTIRGALWLVRLLTEMHLAPPATPPPPSRNPRRSCCRTWLRSWASGACCSRGSCSPSWSRCCSPSRPQSGKRWLPSPSARLLASASQPSAA
jgi:hypothetical protein